MHNIIWIRIIDLTDIRLIQLIAPRTHQTLLNLRYIALVLTVELLLLQMLLHVLAQLPQVPLLEQIIHILLHIELSVICIELNIILLLIITSYLLSLRIQYVIKICLNLRRCLLAAKKLLALQILKHVEVVQQV